MNIRVGNKQVDIDYEKSGSYHIYRANAFGVEISDLNKVKSYEKFTKELSKAVTNPKR